MQLAYVSVTSQESDNEFKQLKCKFENFLMQAQKISGAVDDQAQMVLQTALAASTTIGGSAEATKKPEENGDSDDDLMTTDQTELGMLVVSTWHVAWLPG